MKHVIHGYPQEIFAATFTAQHRGAAEPIPPTLQINSVPKPTLHNIDLCKEPQHLAIKSARMGNEFVFQAGRSLHITSVAEGVFFQDLCPIQQVCLEILEYVWGILSSILACRSSTSRFSSSSTQLPVPVATSRIGTALARPLRGLLLWPLGDQRWFWR